MNWIEYILLILLPLTAGWLTYVYGQMSQQLQRFILAVSGAYVFGITILDLGPKVLLTGIHWVALFILAGFLLQVLIEYFSKGIEHGHAHGRAHPDRALLISIMAGLCLHSLMEGIPLSESSVSLVDIHHQSLFWGILIHKIPAAIALASLMVTTSLKKLSSIGLLLLFSLMTPLSSALSDWIFGLASGLTYVLAVVAGSFLHISTTLMFESGSRSHHFNLLKMLAITSGFLLAALTTL